MNKSDTEKPLVTFALFCYNQERFIREAVEGALSQAYSPLEIILSDDCSTDATFEILQEIAEKYVGQHELTLNRNQQNLGIAGHVNKIFGVAKGAAVVMAAGDDVSLPHRVEILVETWVASNFPPAVGSGFSQIDGDGMEIGGLPNWQSMEFHGFEQQRYLCVKNFVSSGLYVVPGATAMWSADLFKLFGGIPGNVICEDRILSLASWLDSRPVITRDLLVKYRKHDSNIWGQNLEWDGSAESYRQNEKESARKSEMHYQNHCAYGSMLSKARELRLINEIECRELIELNKVSLSGFSSRRNWWKKSFTEKLLSLFDLKHGQFSGSMLMWKAQRLLGLNQYCWLRSTARKLKNSIK